MNFSEQLAYWYLRLNGFIPLANFVLHHEANYHRTSDADIIAVRFPHVFEQVGGNPKDWDKQFEQWGLPLDTATIGLIVEVKSGDFTKAELQKHLGSRHWRALYAIRRLGMFTEADAKIVARDLRDQPIACLGGFKIAKLLIATTDIKCGSWLYIDLNSVAQFICQRMREYAPRKRKDRLFFEGDLIQFLAWRCG